MEMKKILTNTAAVILLATGAAALLFVMGDEAPDAHLSFGEFALLKTGALAVLAAVIFAARGLYRRGLLPKWLTE